MIFLTILAFIGILGLLIFAHELGHFLTAKAAGVKVEEFAFGFPPRLLSIKRGETRYSINLLPIGGYVKMLGEEDPTHPGSLASKGALTRLAVLGAGPLMNILLPIILFSIAFMIPAAVIKGNVQITEAAPGSPAESAGIEAGDIIISVNNHPIENISDLQTETLLNLGKSITLDIESKDGIAKQVSLVPRWNPPEDEGAMGIGIDLVNTYEASVSYPFWEAIPKGAQESWQTIYLMRNEVARWFAQKEAPQLTGPVGIFQITGMATEAGPSYLMQFAAFLSINLAIINLFPIPALDGGRIALVLLEIVRRGKRISPRREQMAHLIGFIMLMGLIITITSIDVLRLIRGESLLP